MTTPVCSLVPAQQACRRLIMRGLEGENEACLAGVGHRTAVIEDSRRLPLSELALEGAT
jgi:hypothetical protein